MHTARPTLRSRLMSLKFSNLLAAAATLLGAFSLAHAQGSGQLAGNGEIRVAFIGDSMADGMWGGLVRATSNDACLKGHFTLGRFGENGTGLTRADKFNWAEEIRKITASFSPDLVIVSFGLNDRQGVVEPDHVTRVEFGAPEWPKRYSSHVSTVLAEGSVGKAGLLWVGLPSLRDQVPQADAREKNRLYDETVQSFHSPKVRFVEPWRLSPEGDDPFKPYGTGPSGEIVALRATDGIHFTVAGYDSVAAYLLPRIIAHLEDQQVAVPRPCPK
jgi:uncharacterized protein